MSMKIIRLGVLVLAGALFLLTACSDFEEMQGQRALMNAEKLVEQKNNRDAETAMGEVVTQFPGTRAADAALKRFNYLQLIRERRERREIAEILDSFSLVLNGYRSMYSEYPQSINVLDESEYFFDSTYLNEITPKEFQVFLSLKQDGAGFRAWCVHKSRDKGYGVNSGGDGLTPFPKDDLINNLKEQFGSDDWNNSVVYLGDEK